MNLLRKLGHLVQDPPPWLAIELSEAGIAWARNPFSPNIGFLPLAPDVLRVSPVLDNVHNAIALAECLGRIAPKNGSRKRRKVAVILPDFSARVSVLDFDSFPGSPQEQAALVRFRVKKSVPFDVDSAAVSFRAQPAKNKRVEVVAAVIALEIIGRYEGVFRQMNLHAGYITTSLLAALDLVRDDGLSVVVKRTGAVLSLAVLDAGALRLVRSVELPELSVDATLGVLFPTFAFAEDEFKRRPRRLLACGFGAHTDSIRAACQAELGILPEPLPSRYGVPAETNAGLLGYLESVRES